MKNIICFLLLFFLHQHAYTASAKGALIGNAKLMSSEKLSCHNAYKNYVEILNNHGGIVATERLAEFGWEAFAISVALPFETCLAGLVAMPFTLALATTSFALMPPTLLAEGSYTLGWAGIRKKYNKSYNLIRDIITVVNSGEISVNLGTFINKNKLSLEIIQEAYAQGELCPRTKLEQSWYKYNYKIFTTKEMAKLLKKKTL